MAASSISVGFRLSLLLHGLLPLADASERLHRVDVGHGPGSVVRERTGRLLPAVGLVTESLGQHRDEDARLVRAEARKREQSTLQVLAVLRLQPDAACGAAVLVDNH